MVVVCIGMTLIGVCVFQWHIFARLDERVGQILNISLGISLLAGLVAPVVALCGLVLTKLSRVRLSPIRRVCLSASVLYALWPTSLYAMLWFVDSHCPKGGCY